VAGPSVRIGVLWGADSIEVSPNASFEFADENGRFLARGDSGETWRIGVRDTRPAVISLRLVAGSMSSRGLARKKAGEIEALGFQTEIHPVGPAFPPAGTPGVSGKYYRILLANVFDSEASARAFRDSVRDRFETFLVREVREPSSGLILLKCADRQLEYESGLPVVVRGASVTIQGVPVGTGFHWEQNETRSYPDTVWFRLDTDGKVAAVVQLPIEKYLEGVLPSEMHAGFPREALKAQAVAARSKALANLGLLHTADPFDLCADVHCQVFSGLSRAADGTSRAVRETAGLVLWNDGRICDAVYGAVCGGHTEDVNRAWQTRPKAHLRGVEDGPKSLKKAGPLEREENAIRWITDRPQAFCNTADRDVPAALNYTKKYFRWELVLRQEDLAAQIEKRGGRGLGEIRELVPLERGVSGRITRLKIVGTAGDTVVSGELAIRRMLSPTTLWSSCFTVFKQEEESGPPSVFVLKGAGWGHGVGLCQTGAAGLALRGKAFDKILRHYSRNASIKKLY
jgi:SpoIID/LytB domain protein